jgi:hypothetical protein
VSGRRRRGGRRDGLGWADTDVGHAHRVDNIYIYYIYIYIYQYIILSYNIYILYIYICVCVPMRICVLIG